MPRLPGISQKQAVRVFQKLGYRVVRESGHLIMSNGVSRLVIPRHDPIHAITMGAIARGCRADAGAVPPAALKAEGEGILLVRGGGSAGGGRGDAGGMVTRLRIRVSDVLDLYAARELNHPVLVA